MEGDGFPRPWVPSRQLPSTARLAVGASLFGSVERPPQAARLAPVLRAWADRGVYFGTSSWKYPGWVGSIYSNDSYVTRKKFSKTKFLDTCLAEYAQTFPVVGGDF